MTQSQYRFLIAVLLLLGAKLYSGWLAYIILAFALIFMVSSLAAFGNETKQKLP